MTIATQMDDDHLQALAALANIDMSAEERARLLPAVQAMATMIDSLRSVPLPDDIEPMIDGGPGPWLPPRDDVESVPAGRALLDGAGRFDAVTGLLSVPRVVGAAE